MKFFIAIAALAMFSTATFADTLYPCHVTTGTVTGTSVTQNIGDNCPGEKGGHGYRDPLKCKYEK